MADLIVASHVAIWLSGLNNVRHTSLDRFLIVAESQENWAYVRGLYISQFGPISLFLGKRELMALDAVGLIVLDRG